MTIKGQSYRQTLLDLVGERNVSEEAAWLFSIVRDDAFARELLVADDLEGILKSHSNYVLRLTCAVRTLVEHGLIGQGDRESLFLKSTESLRRLCLVHLACLGLQVAAKTENWDVAQLLLDLFTSGEISAAIHEVTPFFCQ